MKKCPYCRKADNPDNAAHCSHCGGLLEEDQKAEQPNRLEWNAAWFHRGHIIWAFSHLERDVIEYQFWRGQDLLQRLEFSRELLKELNGGDQPGIMFDFDKVVWPYFELAQGERDVLIYEERNKKYPAQFLVTRIENPDKMRWREGSFDRQQILEMIRR